MGNRSYVRLTEVIPRVANEFERVRATATDAHLEAAAPPVYQKSVRYRELFYRSLEFCLR